MHTFFEFISAITDVVVVVGIAVDASVVCIVCRLLGIYKVYICQNFMLYTLLLSLCVSINGRYVWILPESTTIYSLSNGAHMVGVPPFNHIVTLFVYHIYIF